MPRRVPDLSKIAGLIGYQPRVGLDEILRLVIQFYKAR
jgi:nucleoside-diphosphate-sugar epimerase